MSHFRVIKFLFLFFVILNSAFALDVDSILKKIDELYRADSSFSKMEMYIETPQWKRTMQMDIWTKGMDYTFVLVNFPNKDKGVATLKRKQDMWNFFPKINKVIKVPPSMMMSSWMGSDFTNDDLVKESTLKDDYEALILEDKDSANYHIQLTPKKDVATVWGKIIVVVDRKEFIPVTQDFYDERGEKIRTMVFKDIKIIDGKKVPMTMELLPLSENKKGHKTVVKYLDLKFNASIPDSTFTRSNLQQRR